MGPRSGCQQKTLMICPSRWGGLTQVNEMMPVLRGSRQGGLTRSPLINARRTCRCCMVAEGPARGQHSESHWTRPPRSKLSLASRFSPDKVHGAPCIPAAPTPCPALCTRQGGNIFPVTKTLGSCATQPLPCLDRRLALT